MSKIEHLKAIEFEWHVTKGWPIDMVALYNESRIDEATVRELINTCPAESRSQFVVIMFKSQYENLFDLGKSPKEEFYGELNDEQKETM